jgi:single-stranded-DNA-specific exonuclease
VSSELLVRAQRSFGQALEKFGPNGRPLLLSHNDADGLSAAAILARALRRTSRPLDVRILGRGENPWSAEIRAEIDAAHPSGLLVVDLGVREGEIAPGLPTVIIDHHVPTGQPGKATVITGFGSEPVPTSSLLAYWCASALVDVDDLLWIAALGIVGDMADQSGFVEYERARRQHGVTSLRNAAAFINAPRRSSSGDATPALQLLMKADGPKELMSGVHAETAAVFAAREEVKQELERVRRTAPKIAGQVALVFFSSGCQLHPLLAQTWRNRLKGNIVLAANAGYRPGWIHFSARTALDIDLVEFLRSKAPPGADENYGSGHLKASGGALRPAAWNAFVGSLGFGAEVMMPE